MTEAEYLVIERQADTRSDFYRGEMFSMAGAKRRHNLIVSNVIAELRDQLRSRPCEVYPSDMRVKVARTGLFTYPDVVVVCGQPQFLDDNEDTLLNPTLIVEVLSKSTEQYVRCLKTFRYRRLPSLRQYVLIEQDQPLVEIYQRTTDGKWQIDDTDDLTGTVELKSIECVLKLAAVYEKVAFDEAEEESAE
jgi:Uma2 family endonuclease